VKFKKFESWKNSLDTYIIENNNLKDLKKCYEFKKETYKIYNSKLKNKTKTKYLFNFVNKKIIKKTVRGLYEFLFNEKYELNLPGLVFPSSRSYVSLDNDKSVSSSYIHLDTLRPDIIFEEIMHYVINCKFSQKTNFVLKSENLKYLNIENNVLQHYLISSMINIIYPEFFDDNLKIKQQCVGKYSKENLASILAVKEITKQLIIS
jgi:hypothetical protein